MTPAAEHSVCALNALDTLSCDSAVFISDLHLSVQTPRLIAQFERFCSGLQSEQTQWLIVMGDLFEGYCGDDDRNSCIEAVEQAFLALHHRNVRVALMHGNRDFMIGADFARRCQAVLLSDPCLVNGSLLLSHGDAWCTLDTGYQAFRATSRQTAWQKHWLSLPLLQRQAQIQAYRAQSKAAQMDVSSHSTDVVDEQVLYSARRYGCLTVLHGHTHRPSDRLLTLDGLTPVRKVVLGDWGEEPLLNQPSDESVNNRFMVVCAGYVNSTLTTFTI